MTTWRLRLSGTSDGGLPLEPCSTSQSGMPLAKVAYGPTEDMSNLLQRVKRVTFAFPNLESFRIRALLYSGKPNFKVLDSIVVR
ncbi:MAG: hypothetical protein ACYCST_16600 [Acidimicrobiales bacterium]